MRRLEWATVWAGAVGLGLLASGLELDWRQAHVGSQQRQIERMQTRAELYAAISELPDDFRDALIAIAVVGLSYREAAQALRVREATITTRLHRARQRVARTLVPENAPENS